MQTDDVLALEQSAESSSGAVGVNGFPHRYQRGRIRPQGLIWRVDIFMYQQEWYRGSLRFRLLQKRRKRFLFFRTAIKSKEAIPT